MSIWFVRARWYCRNYPPPSSTSADGFTGRRLAQPLRRGFSTADRFFVTVWHFRRQLKNSTHVYRFSQFYCKTLTTEKSNSSHIRNLASLIKLFYFLPTNAYTASRLSNILLPNTNIVPSLPSVVCFLLLGYTGFIVIARKFADARRQLGELAVRRRRIRRQTRRRPAQH